MIRDVELLVVGLGVIGAATAREAARRGAAVVGLDRFRAPHARGSSHGRSRAHSLFYQEPYLDLALRAREEWLSIQAEAGAPLFHACGMLVWDQLASPGFDAVVADFRRARLPHELMTPGEMRRRFPLLAPPESSRGCWMPTAGFLDADVCVGALLDQARGGGAEIRFDEAVERIDLDGERPVVHTARRCFRAARLVMAPGPWAGPLLESCGWPLTVTRQNVFTYRPAHPADYAPNALPVLGDRITGEYSFPMHETGIKVAQSALGPLTSPDQDQPEPSDEEAAQLSAWLHRTLPSVAAEPVARASCFYTLTPDRGFIVSRHPRHASVVVGVGFSGHGFKFAPEVARMLATLAMDDGVAPPHLAPDRFQQSSSSRSVV